MSFGKTILLALAKEIGYFLVSKYLRPRLSTDREDGGKKINSMAPRK